MDGNGRWAKRRHLPRIAGHRAGVQRCVRRSRPQRALEFPGLTLYAFSEENWKKRPGSEVDFLMGLLRRYLKAEVPTLNKNIIRLEYIGRRHELPPSARRRWHGRGRRPAGNTGMVLTLAMNYSARTELVDAFRSIVDAAARNGGLIIPPSMRTPCRSTFTRGIAGSRSAGPDQRRDAAEQFPALADRLCRNLCHPDLVARVPRRHLLEGIAEFQKRERRYGGLTGSAHDSHPHPSRRAGVRTACNYSSES